MPYSRKALVSARIRELSDNAASAEPAPSDSLAGLSEIGLYNTGEQPEATSIQTLVINKVVKIMRIVPGYFRNTGISQDEKALFNLRKTFDDSTQLWQSLTHLYIAELSSASLDEFALSQEYYACGDLRQYLKRQSGLSMGERLQVMGQVLNGLTYLHSKNPPIIHGCINPAKIYITWKGIPKLGEFSLSQLVSGFPNLAPSINTGGMARWMSPEYFDESSPGTRTTQLDLWSFGCTLFEVITGFLPHPQCKNDAQVLQKLVDHELPGRMDIPSYWRDIPELHPPIELKRPEVPTLKTMPVESSTSKNRGNPEPRSVNAADSFDIREPLSGNFGYSPGSRFLSQKAQPEQSTTIDSSSSSGKKPIKNTVAGGFYRRSLPHVAFAGDLIQKCWLPQAERPSSRDLLRELVKVTAEIPYCHDNQEYLYTFKQMQSLTPPEPRRLNAGAIRLIQFMIGRHMVGTGADKLLQYITSNFCKNVASEPGLREISQDANIADDGIETFTGVLSDGVPATLKLIRGGFNYEVCHPRWSLVNYSSLFTVVQVYAKQTTTTCARKLPMGWHIFIVHSKICALL
ncbi:unnamed protein product [Rhizoctonia solani]|uniref:Protein kinase domain-containing protein n=1 Tax=Rhizoctonia solani TaxID=456999 RepID=A0A8H3AHN7_9AGAM|nr:unnamed protein product [Rhizoctonia solani]